MKTVWTKQKMARLRELFPNHTTIDIAFIMGMSVGSVDRKAYRMGLSKSDSHISDVNRARAEAGKKRPSDAVPLVEIKPGRVRYVSQSGLGGMNL